MQLQLIVIDCNTTFQAERNLYPLFPQGSFYKDIPLPMERSGQQRPALGMPIMPPHYFAPSFKYNSKLSCSSVHCPFFPGLPTPNILEVHSLCLINPLLICLCLHDLISLFARLRILRLIIQDYFVLQ